VTVVEEGGPGLPPADAAVLSEGPVEVRAAGSRRWLSPAGGEPLARVDLLASRIVMARSRTAACWVPAALGLLAALRLRGLEPLHAAAVSAGDGAVLLLAPSGGGKSTATARLAAEGLDILSDDTVVLDGAAVHGLGSGIVLRRPAGLPAPGALPGTRGTRLVLPVPRCGPRPLRAVVVLETPHPATPVPLLEPLAPSRVLVALLEAAPFPHDPLTVDRTREVLRGVAATPGFRLAPGAPQTPLLAALQSALTA